MKRIKLLIILSRFPYPLEKGDKLRAYNFIKYLSRNFDIYLFCISDLSVKNEYIEFMKKFCKEIVVYKKSKYEILFSLLKNIFKKFPYQVSYFYSRKAQAELDSFYERISPELIFCQLIRTTEFARNYSIPKMLDYMDTFSKGIERRMAKAPFFLKPIFKTEYLRLVEYEKNMFEYFDVKIIISEYDKSYIKHRENENLIVVPNGVDFEYFVPKTVKKVYDILFVGNMAYPPNVDAARYLVKQIMPLLIKKKSDIKVLISGATPVKEVLGFQSKSITVTGWVDDIRECYYNSRVMVAPMQLGTGMQNKVLEAMAMKIPCIISPLVNHGIKATEGEEAIIADSPEAYIDKIIELLSDNRKIEEISEKAFKFVNENYNWEKILMEFEGLIMKRINTRGLN